MKDGTTAFPAPGATRTITRLMGQRLRDVLSNPEADPLPANHVDLLLQLRHKERERAGRRR